MSNFSKAFKNTYRVIRTSLRLAAREPSILAYPYLALLFIGITYPLIGASIFNRYYNDIFLKAGSVAPHHTAAIIGLVSFSAFYAAFVTAFFTCAVSASILAKLEQRRTPPFYGLFQALRHWWRVSRFAVLSVFLFPVGVYAQRRKLPKGIVGVVGSSVTLHMANLAPSILSTRNRYGQTVRDSINVLGSAWREGLILKVGMYVSIFLIFALPKLIQQHFFTSPHASTVGWLVSLEFATSGFVIFKIINAIFMTVLYHQASSGRGERT